MQIVPNLNFDIDKELVRFLRLYGNEKTFICMSKF